MESQSDPGIFSKDPAAVALFKRRIVAAACDAAVAGVGGLTLFLCCSLWQTPSPIFWKPAVAYLALFFLLDALAGWSTGRQICRLQLRRRDGSPAPIWMKIARAALRHLPVALLVVSMLTPDLFFSAALWMLNILLLCAYFPACYVLLMRTGQTLFDAAVGSSVIWLDRR